MMRVCQNCGKVPDATRHTAAGRITKGRCWACYQYWRRHGRERVLGPCPVCGRDPARKARTG